MLTAFLLSGLLIGCTKKTAPELEIEEESVIAEEENIQEVKEDSDTKSWKNTSTPEGFSNYGIEPTLNAWIAFHSEDISKTTDTNDYYLKSERIIKEHEKYFRIEGEDLQKDFDNLRMLKLAISHFNNVISVQEKDGTDTEDSYNQLNKSFKYFSELLHDINIVINYNGDGETYGVTHQLDGDKVEELESFLY